MEPLRYPDHLRYDPGHTWVEAGERRATVGITAFAAGCWGGAEFVQLPEIGRRVSAGETVAVLHCAEAGACAVLSPLTGRIAELSEVLAEDPELATSDPYGAGWLFRIETEDPGELQDLVDAGVYREITETAHQGDLAAALGSVFAHSVDAMILLDRYRRVLAMNPAAARLTGYAMGDLGGKCRCQQLLHCEGDAGRIHGTSCSGVQAFREMSALRPASISIERKDGRRVRVSVSYSPIPDPENGGPLMLAAMRRVDET